MNVNLQPSVWVPLTIAWLYYAVSIYADFQLGLALLCQDLGVWG